MDLRLAWICGLILASLASASLWGQTAAAVSGTVRDASGAAVAQAPLELDGPTGVLVREGRTDNGGAFTLAGVPFGEYSLVLPAAHGFAAQSVPVHATSGMAPLRILLALESVTQTVDVGGDESLSTDAAANKDAVSLSGQDLEKLPVFDQDYIAALTPFLDPASGATGGITLVVDGVEMKGSGVSASAIKEVRINNDPYSAESRRPGRGRIEIMTKPGSPEFHGELNFLIRDSTLNARNYFAPVKPTEHRRIYEGNVTGPVGYGGHTTFLLTGSRREDDLAGVVHAVGAEGPIDFTTPTPSRNTQFTGRVARDFSAAHRVSIQYNFEYDTTVDTNVGGVVLPEAGIRHDGREDDVVFNDRLILTPKLLNQLQITLEKDEDVFRSATDRALIQVKDSFVGGGAQADLSRTENTIHLNDIVSWTHGRQFLRFGAQLPQVSRRALDDRSNRLGTSQFSSLGAYSSNLPFVFTAQQGVGRGLYWINEVGGFFQDQIKLTPKLEASLGLRYDWQTYLTDNNNLAPRVSLAYAAGKSSKTILRAGAGLFYDRTGGDLPGSVKVHNGTVLRTYQVRNPGYPSPLPPGFPITDLPTNLIRFDAHVRTPYSIQYSFDVERQLTKTVTVTAGYRGLTGVSIFRSRDVNAPLRGQIARPDAALGLVEQYEAHGRGVQDGLDVSFQGRAGRWFNGRAQYTLASNRNNTGGITFFPQDQYNPDAEWGRADTDRRQRFNVIGNINPDHWLTLGVSATLYSGSPYTVTTGGDEFHTGLGNARPAGVGRNTLETGGVADLDLLWDHDFALNKAKGEHAKVLNVGISAFNVLNRTNFTDYVGSIRSPLFKQPTSALAGRQLQFNMRHRF